MLRSLAPALFVIFWSTGFIVARGVATHGSPMTISPSRVVCKISVPYWSPGSLSVWPAPLYAVFHETLTWLQLAGFALALAGVVLARRAAT